MGMSRTNTARLATCTPKKKYPATNLVPSMRHCPVPPNSVLGTPLLFQQPIVRTILILSLFSTPAIVTEAIYKL